jgi:hypothetical protein
MESFAHRNTSARLQATSTEALRRHFPHTTALLFLLLGLLLLLGCQGVSTGSSGGSGGSAAPQLSVSPATLALGSVVAGSSATASGNLIASGGSITITGATSSSTRFSIGGLSLPATLAAGQSLPFTVTFSPQVAGAANAIVTFTSTAQPSATTQTLTGTGAAASTHSVNLSWNPSTSSISGYNIYRAAYVGSCGSFNKINSLLNTGTLYTDPSVVNGTSYCYAATAVDTSNQESGYSNIVSDIQIPAQ